MRILGAFVTIAVVVYVLVFLVFGDTLTRIAEENTALKRDRQELFARCKTMCLPYAIKYFSHYGSKKCSCDLTIRIENLNE